MIPACLHLLCYQEPVEANLHDGMPNIRSAMLQQRALMAIGAIASKAKTSARLFDKLCYLSKKDLTARTVLVDQSGRLKFWAANIGAFNETPLLSSLDHRLREAPRVADQIRGFLGDLVEALQKIRQ